LVVVAAASQPAVQPSRRRQNAAQLRQARAHRGSQTLAQSGPLQRSSQVSRHSGTHSSQWVSQSLTHADVGTSIRNQNIVNQVAMVAVIGREPPALHGAPPARTGLAPPGPHEKVGPWRFLLDHRPRVAALRPMKLRTALCFGAGLAAMTASCMTPGQYHIFRVASSSADQSSGCYGGSPGPDITGDSSTLRTGQTFAIYAADSETFFMDFDTYSLTGSKDGSDYTFTGQTVDVQTVVDSTVTLTSVTTISAEIHGNKISGTSTVDVTSNCVGGMSCPDPASTQCVTTVDFQGAKVKGVDLEHAI
jgi:hypothetical protein